LLEEQFKQPEGEYMAIIIQAKGDSNGAFYDGPTDLEFLSGYSYNVRIYEIGNKEDFYNLISMLSEKHGRLGPEDLFYIRAHGEPESILLNLNGHPSMLSSKNLLDDQRILENFFSENKPRVVFHSCSAGNPYVEGNIARTFSRITDTYVFAPSIPTSGFGGFKRKKHADIEVIDDVKFSEAWTVKYSSGDIEKFGSEEKPKENSFREGFKYLFGGY
jgi:hypothetical protein